MRIWWSALAIVVACSPFTTTSSGEPLADAGRSDDGGVPEEASAAEGAPASEPDAEAGVACTCPKAPSGWSCFPRNCHLYNAIEKGSGIYRNAAQIECSALLANAHLVTLTSAEENEFVRSLLSSAAGMHYWIGAIQAPAQQNPGDGWSWIQTGEAWSYTNWKTGEPDDSNGQETGKEDSVFMDADGFWIDDGSSMGDVHGYIAEVESSE